MHKTENKSQKIIDIRIIDVRTLIRPFKLHV